MKQVNLNLSEEKKYKFASSLQKELRPFTLNEINKTVTNSKVIQQLNLATLYEPSQLIYEQMKNQIRPLDLIFFSGTEFVSEWIRKVSELTRHSGDWSHVAMVVNKKIMPDLNVSDNDDTLFLWESTISSTYNFISMNHTLDAETGKPFFGVQIRKLDDVIKSDILTKSSIVGWAKLIDNPIDQKDGELYQDYSRRYATLQSTMIDLHQKYYKRPYQLNLFRLYTTLFPCSINDDKLFCGKDWIFCSQLVTLIYKKLGIFPETVKATQVIPEDIDNPSTALQKIPPVVIPAIVLI